MAESRFWECQSCGAIVQKPAHAGVMGMFKSVSGSVQCAGCGHSHNASDVYGGTYDLPEVDRSCSLCGAQLRGPSKGLDGKPCPACSQGSIGP